MPRQAIVFSVALAHALPFAHAHALSVAATSAAQAQVVLVPNSPQIGSGVG